MHKGQILAKEGIGKATIDLHQKKAGEDNTWQIITASDPKAAEPIEPPSTGLSYDGATLVADIKDTLAKRSALAIRGLGRVFRIMDQNRNR